MFIVKYMGSGVKLSQLKSLVSLYSVTFGSY